MIQAEAADTIATFKTSPDLLGALIDLPEERLFTISCRLGRLRTVVSRLAELPGHTDDQDTLWLIYDHLELIEAIAEGARKPGDGWVQ